MKGHDGEAKAGSARLGETVTSAAAWVRAQFPSGDLAGAQQVANALSRGQDLHC